MLVLTEILTPISSGLSYPPRAHIEPQHRGIEDFLLPCWRGRLFLIVIGGMKCGAARDESRWELARTNIPHTLILVVKCMSGEFAHR